MNDIKQFFGHTELQMDGQTLVKFEIVFLMSFIESQTTHSALITNLIKLQGTSKRTNIPCTSDPQES